MSDLISREEAIKDAESWVAVDDYEKHLQKNVVEWLKEFPPAELSTNLAGVGTDCISRQAAIDALAEYGNGRAVYISVEEAVRRIGQLPPIQPEIVRCGESKWLQCNMKPDGYLPKGVDEFECRHWCGSCDREP